MEVPNVAQCHWRRTEPHTMLCQSVPQFQRYAHRQMGWAQYSAPIPSRSNQTSRYTDIIIMLSTILCCPCYWWNNTICGWLISPKLCGCGGDGLKLACHGFGLRESYSVWWGRNWYKDFPVSVMVLFVAADCWSDEMSLCVAVSVSWVVRHCARPPVPRSQCDSVE